MGSGRARTWQSYRQVEENFARNYGRYVALAHPEQPRFNARGDIAMPNEETPVSADFMRSMVDQGLVGQRLNITFVPYLDTWSRNRWNDTARRHGFVSGNVVAGFADGPGIRNAHGIFVPEDVEDGVLFHETVHGWTHDGFYAWTTRGSEAQEVGRIRYPLGRLFLEPATEFLTVMGGYSCNGRTFYHYGVDWIRQQGIGVDLIARAMFTGDCANLERELLRITGKSRIEDVFSGFGNLLNGRGFDDGGTR